MSTRGSTSSRPTLVPLGTRALRKVGFLGCELRVECAWANTQALLSHHLVPPEASPLPSSLPGHQPLLRCLGGCTLRKESWAGDPSTRSLSDFLCFSKSEGRASRIWVQQGFWSKTGQTKLYRFKKSIYVWHPAVLSLPIPSPALGLKPTQGPGMGWQPKSWRRQGMK